MKAWKQSIKDLEKSREHEVDSGTRPLWPREFHWIAYKAVLTDLQELGLMTREEVRGRRTKILNTIASSRQSSAKERQ